MPLSFEMAYGGLGVPDDDIEQLTTALPLSLHPQAHRDARTMGRRNRWRLGGRPSPREEKNPRDKNENLEIRTRDLNHATRAARVVVYATAVKMA